MKRKQNRYQIEKSQNVIMIDTSDLASMRHHH